MKLNDFLNLDELKFSGKRKAFAKLLVKLDKTHERLEQAFSADNSDAERKRLEIKLKTNRKHREKIRMMIAELDRHGHAKHRQSVSTGGLFSNNPY